MSNFRYEQQIHKRKEACICIKVEIYKSRTLFFFEMSYQFFEFPPLFSVIWQKISIEKFHLSPHTQSNSYKQSEQKYFDAILQENLSCHDCVILLVIEQISIIIFDLYFLRTVQNETLFIKGYRHLTRYFFTDVFLPWQLFVTICDCD